jgi:hypothetical protein
MKVYITTEDYNQALKDKNFTAEYYLSIGALYIYEGDNTAYIELELDEV